MEAVLNNSEIASAAEQIFQSVFAVINEGVVILNGHAEITAVNPAAESMLGLAAADLIGQSADTIVRVGKLIHEDGSELSQDSFSAIVASRLRNMVLGIYRTDGTLVWLSINSQALISNGASAPYAEAIIFADITERKRTEQALAAWEHEFRSLADSSPDSIIRYDRDGRIRHLPPGRLRFLGLSATDVIGKLPIEVWPDGRYAEIDRAIVRALETEETTIVELRRADAAEEQHFNQIHVVPERDAAGQIGGAIAFGLDVTAIREEERRQAERTLELTRNHLHSVLQTIPDLVWVKDMEGVYLSCNHAFERFFGAKEVEIVGKTDYDFVDAELADFFRQKDREAIAQDRICINEEWVTFADDKRRVLLEVRKVPLRDTDGNVTGVLGISHDITERKQAEALLVQREREFRILAESLPDNIVRYNREGVTIYVNPVLERTLGDSAAAMIGTTPREYHPDGSFEDYAQLLDAVLASGEAGELEKVFPGSDGRESIHQICMVPERGENGEVAGVFAIGRDITERKQAEESLRASEQKFRSLAENLPDILIRYDREGRRTYVNPVLKQIFAATDKQMIGLTPQEANPINLPETYRLALKHTLATGERSEFEMRLPAASGDMGVGFVTIAAERAEDGQISGAIAIGRDITKLKQSEQQLRELTAHLQTVREEEKARLAREIHDDLGSTLAALKLRLSHLLGFELSEDMKKTPLFARLEIMSLLLENAIAATRRIITDMRPDVLDSLGLLAALKWQAERFHKHTGIGCRIVCADDHGCVNCKGCEYQLDPTLSINLFRIFQEALTNVARHSGATRVEAEYQPTNNEVLLSIRDNGCGLPDDHTVAANSYGIRGMRERVGQLGGEIVFDTPPGGGLRVTVRVPLSVAGTG